ncbi:pyruvate/2-oxoacid:ferredoxin oxidoreductase beta subunit [Scopulibacillus daqui]|uniref:Pyruvate/2-oxoacid:ferredoxin oxidoreductase beta subunit n=1 Tax=Scopulibacillus daqui TaxID=1469162 RepID=A0ABS2Q3D0_9BACL|nr:hypothetical protein [Scopulibacillus daqui]MBM7646802.1 pyruvate/2-oxoacid:ferredoxin oxidoreductase beta subunit [Scopulibacillus daqui]
MKNFMYGALICIFLAGCGGPGISELNQNIRESGKAINAGTWSQAEEETRRFLDNWMYVRSNYHKEDREKLENLTENLEISLAVSNKQKARRDWEKLKHQWDLMND